MKFVHVCSDESVYLEFQTLMIVMSVAQHFMKISKPKNSETNYQTDGHIENIAVKLVIK